MCFQRHSTTGDRAFQNTGFSLWNSLPLSIRHANSVICFKKDLRLFFLDVSTLNHTTNIFASILLVYSALSSKDKAFYKCCLIIILMRLSGLHTGILCLIHYL